MSGVGASATSERHHVSVVSMSRELFHFKVDKAFMGATVEVYDEAGELVGTDLVLKKHMIVDFFNRKAGLYTIKVIKSGVTEEFQYAYAIR